MQLGQVIDYCIEYDNQEQQADKKSEPKKRRATQADIDAFFGGRKKK